MGAGDNGFTDRECEVLRLILFTNEQIGRQLGIAKRTVRNHLTSIYSKLGVARRQAATVQVLHAATMARMGRHIAGRT